MQGMREAMQAARESSPRGPGGPGGSPNDAMKKIRSKMNIELQSILTPEQMDTFKASGQSRGAKRRSGDNDYQPGSVWVLRDGQPVKVDVGIGIADLEYSEIRARELKEGDKVIVRAKKVAE